MIHGQPLNFPCKTLLLQLIIVWRFGVCVAGLYLLWTLLLSDAPFTGDRPMVIQLDRGHLTEATLNGIKLQCVCRHCERGQSDVRT